MRETLNLFSFCFLCASQVFSATLTNLQVTHCLTDIDSWRLFANLNELCLVRNDPVSQCLSNTTVCWQAFQESICHCLQTYCLNYSTALLYLDSLKPREDFGTYVKWCERSKQCRRLHLRDLLVAPLQRLTRYPLLLRNIAKRCQKEDETRGLELIAEQNLKHLLKAVTLDNLISHRSLLHEGKLVLTENAKLIDVYMFLFDEFLLITKMKRNKKIFSARMSVGPEQNPLKNLELDQMLKEGCTFTVLDQPISLDRLQLRNIDQLNASSSGLPHSFIVMHQNRYQQCIGAFILQAASEAVKVDQFNCEYLKCFQREHQARVKSSSLWLESSQI
uniref:Pleckstrin homology domain containing, family G (with RhoGef domain) member 7 n=1 Tax=Neolamprologus brichardi TaxID=32507 RepID=A0A3Q4GP33_NEOBR